MNPHKQLQENEYLTTFIAQEAILPNTKSPYVMSIRTHILSIVIDSLLIVMDRYQYKY